jgi:hypothetical protein
MIAVVFGTLFLALGLVYITLRVHVSKREAIVSLGDHEPFEDFDSRLTGIETPED